MKLNFLKPKNSKNFGSKKSSLDFLGNQYFWIILISDLILLYLIIKYSNILFVGYLTKNPDLSTAGVAIALFIFKFIFDIYISIKKFKEND